jgi:hypothetical protein
MTVSRRGILAGLLLGAAAPAAAIESKPELPKQTFVKGMIGLRYVMAPDPRFSHMPLAYAPCVMLIEHDIYDGEKFVPYNSGDGQKVIDDLMS